MRQVLKTLTLTSLLSTFAGLSHAQSSVPEDDVVIVTGARIASGGAQDIKHFRGEVDRGIVPSPQGMTSEGLLNQHDLYLTSAKTCAQTLCLNAATKIAAFVDGDYFAGLGFDTNISESWTRPSLNLIAVIDRSGSMGRGASMENVKRSLHAIKDELQDGDQISFVLYGSDVVTHLEPLKITSRSKKTLSEKIDSIKIEGSTNMDAGLARGYEIAYETKTRFEGTTRVMIFTDERPNTGRVDADGFMSRAKKASLEGVGLTTIGYGVDYGGEMAAQIASVRGGNLFYIRGEEDVKATFGEEFDFMVSEVAHDMRVTLTPAAGLQVGSIYGVPQDMISTTEDGAVTMSVSTVFMSSQGGGLFMSLDGTPSRPEQPLFKAEIQYTEGKTRRRDAITAKPLSEPPLNLVKAEALSAQYTAMKTATQAYYDRKYDEAYDIFSAFEAKFSDKKIEGLEEEYELVSALNETLAIEAGKIETLKNPPKYALLRGGWEVTRAKNMLDVKRGDRFNFSKNHATHYRKSMGFDTPYEEERYQVNDSQIYLRNSDLTFKYSFTKKGNLRLRHRDQGTAIYLKPFITQQGSGDDILD